MTENVPGLICRIIKNLESSTFKEINWIGMVKDELETIEQTLVAISRVLPDAQEQQSRNTAIKKWLHNLELVAMDIEDEIGLILTQHNWNLKVRTLHQRFPGMKRARELKALGQRLDEVDHNRKRFNLQELPPPSHKKNLFWCLATGLVREKSLDKALDDVNNEIILRADVWQYKARGRAPTLEEAEMFPKFCRPTEHDLYRIENCRASENRRR